MIHPVRGHCELDESTAVKKKAAILHYKKQYTKVLENLAEEYELECYKIHNQQAEIKFRQRREADIFEAVCISLYRKIEKEESVDQELQRQLFQKCLAPKLQAYKERQKALREQLQALPGRQAEQFATLEEKYIKKIKNTENFYGRILLDLQKPQ